MADCLLLLEPLFSEKSGCLCSTVTANGPSHSSEMRPMTVVSSANIKSLTDWCSDLLVYKDNNEEKRQSLGGVICADGLGV